MTEASTQALSILRSLENFQWYVIPMMMFVVYVYLVEIERGRWNLVFTGLIFMAMEFGWEMFNSLVLHFTQYAPLWSTPGDTAFLIMVGINIEIFFFFAVIGLFLAKSLPKDKKLRILGIPNRILFPVALAFSCLLVEIVLNMADALVWDWKYWSWPHVWSVFASYSLAYLTITWVHDRFEVSGKVKILIGLVALDVAAWVVLAEILGWI